MKASLLAAISRRRSASPAVLWSADFTALTPGAVTLPSGLALTRAGTNATVRTGAATVSSPLAANAARCYSDGTHKGLLIEAAATNLLSSPRAPQTVAPWSSGTHVGATNATAAPDGSTTTAFRAYPGSGELDNYQALSGLSLATYTGSGWFRLTAGSGTGPYQLVINDNSTHTTCLTNSKTAIGQTWVPDSGQIVQQTTGGVFITADGRDQVAAGGYGPAQAYDYLVDLMQFELGGIATSFVIGTRNADLLNDAGLIPRSNGALKIEFQVWPLGLSSGFLSDQQLWYLDANNGAKVVQSTRKVTVTLGGVSAILPVAIPSFTAFDDVRLYVECGGGNAAHAWADVNGTVTDLGYATLAGNVAAGTLQLLNNGTANVFTSIPRAITVYQ